MSIDVYVFLKKSDLPSAMVWQQTMQKHNLPVEFCKDFDPQSSSGFVPCKVKGSDSGFEYFWEAMDGIQSMYPDLRPAVQIYDAVALFTFGGHIYEMAAAISAAATLSVRCSGLLYDPQSGQQFKKQTALDYAHQILTLI